MATTVFSVRLPDELLVRLDGVLGDRSRNDFIRGAIEGALGSGVSPERAVVSRKVDRASEVRKKPKPAPRVSPAVSGAPTRKDGKPLRDDAVTLLNRLREKPMSSRDLEREMGWLGIRYQRAEAELISAGVVRYAGGLLEVV